MERIMRLQVARVQQRTKRKGNKGEKDRRERKKESKTFSLLQILDLYAARIFIQDVFNFHFPLESFLHAMVNNNKIVRCNIGLNRFE